MIPSIKVMERLESVSPVPPDASNATAPLTVPPRLPVVVTQPSPLPIDRQTTLPPALGNPPDLPVAAAQHAVLGLWSWVDIATIFSSCLDFPLG
jgi:hypothetical protein